MEFNGKEFLGDPWSQTIAQIFLPYAQGKNSGVNFRRHTHNNIAEKSPLSEKVIKGTFRFEVLGRNRTTFLRQEKAAPKRHKEQKELEWLL